MCTDEEFREIEASGCNMGSEMEYKAAVNRQEVEKIRENSNKMLRFILF